MTELQTRLAEVRRASRRATIRVIGFFVLLFTVSAMCFWGWMAMIKMIVS